MADLRLWSDDACPVPIVFDLNQPNNRGWAKIRRAAAMASALLESTSRTPPATMTSIFSRWNRVNVRLTVSIVSPS